MSNSDIHEAETLPPPPPKRRCGFAAMSPEKHREIASMGGKANKPETRTFYLWRQLAKEAGRKGGRVSQQKRRERAQ